jgi:hypothetical protein
MADAQIGESRKQAEDLQQPEHYDDDDYAIEDGLDARLQGDESVHEPKQHTDDDQCEKYLN